MIAAIYRFGGRWLALECGELGSRSRNPGTLHKDRPEVGLGRAHAPPTVNVSYRAALQLHDCYHDMLSQPRNERVYVYVKNAGQTEDGAHL
jgi:hypothetical protein